MIPKIFQLGLLDTGVYSLALFYLNIEEIGVYAKFDSEFSFERFHLTAWTRTILQLLNTFLNEVISNF